MNEEQFRIACEKELKYIAKQERKLQKQAMASDKTWKRAIESFIPEKDDKRISGGHEMIRLGLKRAGALAAGVAVAFALTVFLGGCASEEDALPEENVKYEIALVTDDSLVMDGGHSETAWNAITEFGGTHGISHKYYKATEQTDAAFIEAIKAAINKGAKIVIVDNSASRARREGPHRAL